MKSIVADPVTLAYHELRAPLGLMATAARSAAEDCADEALRRRCEIIVRAAERMLSTAQSVLSLAEGAEEADSGRFAVLPVVQRLAEDSRALGFPVFVTPGTEACDTCEIDAPLAQFETLIQSMLNNAQMHGSDGPDALVQIAVRREANCAVIEVMNRLPQQRRHKGIGASTYLANRIASQFGGMVEAGPEGDRYRAALIVPLAESEA